MVKVACTVEGGSEEVTVIIVCTFDPLARVVGACMVLTTAGGVVTVTITDVLGGVDVVVDDVVLVVVLVVVLMGMGVLVVLVVLSQVAKSV